MLSSRWRTSFITWIIIFISLATTQTEGFNFQRRFLNQGRQSVANKSLSTVSGTYDRGILNAGSVPSGGAAATDQPSNRRRVARHILPISTALVIGSFSIFEIVESIREASEFRLGHAHAITTLAFIRLCRSIAILQTQADETLEQIKEIQDEIVWAAQERKTILSMLGKFIISPVVTISACVFATIASAVEIFDDLKPGAHHGAALLALSELNYQLRRLARYRRKGKAVPAEKVSLVSKGQNRLGVLIAVAAALYAAFEIYEDIQPGAHHAVAILALAEFVENLNQSKILH